MRYLRTIQKSFSSYFLSVLSRINKKIYDENQLLIQPIYDNDDDDDGRKRAKNKIACIGKKKMHSIKLSDEIR